MRKFNVIIIGGGVAGLSTAYHLALRGERSVLVLEQEKDLGGHASGRNAGMLRQALSDPVLAQIAAKSRRVFDRAPKMGWKKLDLRVNGSMLLSSDKDKKQLDEIHATIDDLGLGPVWFTKEQASRKVSALKDARFDHALFCPSDAMVDIDALLDGFLNQLKARKVSVLRGKRLYSTKSADNGFLVKAGTERYFADKLVNAAGAWAGWIAQSAGASELPLTAYRRHLFFSRPSPAAAREWGKWPFVWDVSHDLYFRPYGNRLMLSPCDKTAEPKLDRKEQVNLSMKKRLYDKLGSFRGPLTGMKVREAKSGLRTMTPDGRFVIGPDVRRKGFFWVAGLGGHGMTTCFAVGELAADLVLGNKVESRIEKALAPSRFQKRTAHVA